MNPQLDQTPGLGLPQPSFEMGQVPPSQAPQAFHAPEDAAPTFNPMVSPMPQPPMPAQAEPMMPLTQPQGTAPQGLPVMPMQANTAIPGEDTETPVDQEWVVKAREIVNRTRTDPYLQSKELGRIKAQYIKANYNKDIKVSEE